MTTQPKSSSVDVRSLPGTRETVAYKGGGLFPVLAVAPNGVAVAVLRGGAGHVGLAGRIEVIRSLDSGQTWTPPNVVADSDWDDRNPAFGVSHKGTLVLSYHRQGSYDEEGNYLSLSYDDPTRRVVTMVTRSCDAGLTWDRPFPLQVESLRGGSPFGKIVASAEGTLLMPVYHAGSHIVRSDDDGKTWTSPSLIAAPMNETALLVLPNGDILAVMRGEGGRAWEGLYSSHSSDGGTTWSEPAQVTSPGQHPGDLVMLSDGSILLTYGNRNPPYRVEGLVSRDGGHSWLDCLLTFSGALYGYTAEGPRRTDLGYPSSVVLRGSGAGEGITIYYYNPSLNKPASWNDRQQEAAYHAHNYYAIAVRWSEAELIERLGQLAACR